MAISFITTSPYIQKQKQQEDVKQKSDVAAVLASNSEKSQKQDSSRADVAAVLAMSDQPPVSSEQRDLCLA
ncbi:hypothetical protein IKA92_01445 [bacterium]|nr:hypothetical protein [bacterium]